jgi:hypothetical protein
MNAKRNQKRGSALGSWQQIKPTSIVGSGSVAGPTLPLFGKRVERKKAERPKEKDGASCWAIELRP